MPYLGNIPATQFAELKYQDFTGGTGTSFTLNDPVGTAQELEVFVNNVRQEPGVAYTVSGTALTMTGSIVATDDFYVVFQGKSTGTATHPAGQALTATDGTFTGDLTVDTNTLKVDAANNRVGVGSTSPSTLLHVSGSSVVTKFESSNNQFTTEFNYNNSTSRAFIGTFDNNLVFAPSNATVGMRLTSDGLCFGSDTAAVNALDDYEEGTWTPTDGSGQGLSLTIYSAKYTKIGNTVYLTIYGRYPTNTNSSNAFIAGLPFPGENTSNLYHILCAGYKTNSSLVAGLIFPNQSYFDFRNETGSNLTNTNMSGHDFIMSGVYQT